MLVSYDDSVGSEIFVESKQRWGFLPVDGWFHSFGARFFLINSPPLSLADVLFMHGILSDLMVNEGGTPEKPTS